MKAGVLSESRAAEWNALVAEEDAFSLAQSWDWGVFKERLGWKARRVAVEDRGTLIAGAQLLFRPLPVGCSIAYVPRGPVGSWLADETAALLFCKLEELARRNHAIFLKLEPAVVWGEPRALRILGRHGFRPSQIANQAQTTILLDIGRPRDDILMQMRKKTRQYVRRAGREGITTRVANSGDLPAFCELMRRTGKRERFAVHGLEYYRAEWETLSANDQCAFLLAFYQEDLVAVRTVFRCGRHAAEIDAGSVTVPGLHPNHLLVWQAIKWAQERGCTTYDLWGIPNEVDPALGDQQPEPRTRHDGLWGVYQFKRGFGSSVVRNVGAYDRVFVPGLHLLLESPILAQRRWERFAAGLDGAARPSRESKGVNH